MSKYQVGDKVVLRKNLVDGAMYGGCYWVSAKCSLVAKDYVTIDYAVPCGGVYHADEWVISDEMIQGLYTEEGERFLFRTGEVAGYSLFLRKGALLGELSHVGDIETLAESHDYLLTEEEARQSPLYDSLIKVPLSEAVAPKYVLNKGDLYVGRLNSIKGPIVIGSDCELEGLDIVTEFTDTEVEVIQQAVADLTVNKA